MSDRNAAFISFARITTGLNDGLRVTYNGSTSTVTLDSGVYWLGQRAIGGASDASVYPGATSLLAHIRSKVGSACVGILQRKGQSAVTSASTGHVWWTFPQAGDGFLWGHAETTIDPEWFGVAKSSGTYPTKTVASGGVLEDLSDFSSTLAYVVKTPNNRDVVHDERRSDVRRRRSSQVDSGKIYDVNFGTIKGARSFLLRVGGLERELDNSYKSAMRWHGQLLDSGQSFLYFPDLSILSGIASWDGDDSAGAAYAYGIQRFKLDPEDDPVWDPELPQANYHNLWDVTFRAVPFSP